jgi:hypothetical protein
MPVRAFPPRLTPTCFGVIDGEPDVMDVIRDRIKPGTVLVTTDLSASLDPQRFTVMDAPTS